jgi:hypothetical protein
MVRKTPPVASTGSTEASRPSDTAADPVRTVGRASSPAPVAVAQRPLGADKIAAIGALYQAETAFSAASANISTAMVASAVVYITASIAFVDQIVTSSVWAGVLLPAPLWMAALIHSMSTAAAMIRGVSLRALESHLLKAGTFLAADRPLFGAHASELIMNVTMARWPHKVAKGFAYAGSGSIIVLFTIYLLFRVSTVEPVVAVGGAAIYAAMVAILGASWVASLRLYRACAAQLLRDDDVFAETVPPAQAGVGRLG